MNRNSMLAQLTSSTAPFDVIVIGGGATGLGIAIDAISRGYRTILLEQDDFSKGTSSRSTKLVHGGVRYLQQGNLPLVMEALHERGIMRRNAPHLVHDLAFVVPNYDWWETPFYGIGMKVYDVLAGRHGFGRSRILSLEETLQHLPTIETKGLRGGVLYYDGQFDDSRLAINLAQTAADQGAVLLNYMPVTAILKEKSVITGVVAIDIETGERHGIHGKVVINATGVFSDAIRQMDEPGSAKTISPSQGVHIVLEKSFLPGNSAIMVPHTDDGRVLFAIPWQDHVVVGTTDTPLNEISLEPRALPEEIEFLLVHAARYLTRDPKKEDVLSIFAGLRPLVGGGDNIITSAISRDHVVNISNSGLVSVAGGKWTTYRKIAEDVVNQAAVIGELTEVKSTTEHLNIHGYHKNIQQFGDYAVYGADAVKIQKIITETPELGIPIDEKLPITPAQVIWAVRKEMARTVEDVLSRRTRSLLFDARTSIKIARTVAQIMAKELAKDETWIEEQTISYTKQAKGYIL